MIWKVIPLFFLLAGIFILAQIALPIINYKFWEATNIEEKSILASPLSDGNEVLGVSIQNTGDNFPALISSVERDFTPYPNFLISVPSLDIEEAKVIVDSNDLTLSLAHLPGTALPGEKGNVFISGHSAIPIVYNGNKNYGAIFAKLQRLEKGDIIKVSAGGEFSYKVLGIKVVDPKDTSIILPPDGVGRYISLMTCVPPGLNTKRLVVLGKMI